MPSTIHKRAISRSGELLVVERGVVYARAAAEGDRDATSTSRRRRAQAAWVLVVAHAEGALRAGAQPVG
jgi:hypothetical protein